MIRHFLITATASLLLMACNQNAAPPAPAPAVSHTLANWQVIQEKAGSKMLCYAAAYPSKSAGSATQRTNPPYLMVTRRESGKLEISARAGYPYKPGSKVELAVDDDTYTLFFRGDIAWAKNDDEDRDIVDAIAHADSVELRALAADNRTSIDSYSPEGFADSVARIRKFCP